MSRVRLSRVKGSKLPPNTIICDRRGIWGNPYKVEAFGDGYMLANDPSEGFGQTVFSSREDAVRASLVLHRLFLRSMSKERRREFLLPLVGKNLACWCALDAPCHVDNLLDSIREEFET